MPCVIIPCLDFVRKAFAKNGPQNKGYNTPFKQNFWPFFLKKIYLKSL